MSDNNDDDILYKERVEKIGQKIQNKKGENDSTGSEDAKIAKNISIFVGTFVSLGLLIGSIAIGELGVGLIVAIIAIGILATLANVDNETWEEFLGDIEDINHQQQSSSSESDPTRICSSCGWQNPRNNNYCHDCGSELS